MMMVFVSKYCVVGLSRELWAITEKRSYVIIQILREKIVYPYL